MNKQQLASKIWESANKMRSKIEANEYKDYILGFIFYKYLSDQEVRYLKGIGFSDEDLESITEDNVEVAEEVGRSIGYFISYENLFSTWLSMGADFGVSNVRDALSSFNRLIFPTHKHVFANIFQTLETGLSKLGDSTGSQTKAISELIYLIKDIPMDGKQDYDVLGFIYEYLISNFAANAGKKAGEFYTPHEVSQLMSEIVADHLKDKTEISIYDPTSGSGSLLITIGKSVSKYLDTSNIKYYAQELKENTYNLTRMNLVMRGIKPDNIVTSNGDTLEDDWPEDPNIPYEPKRVEAVVSNPPYSQPWSPENKDGDPRFADYGLAPKSKADFAFLLHDLYHIKADSGIMTIVLPHGVLFRGGEEGQIRKTLIEKNKIDTIIGLPANIFFGTGIPTIIMVLKHTRPSDDVLIIDASKGFVKEGKSNKLRACDIKRIVDAVINRKDVDKFARLVSKEEIRANDYNLNIPRYVDSSEPAESWDIYALMFGGVPQQELDALAPYWNAFPSLKDALFTSDGTPYFSVGVENVDQAIRKHPDVVSFCDLFASKFSDFSTFLEKELIDSVETVHLGKEEDAISDEIFARMEGIPLVDKYEAYQILDDCWKDIAADLELIQMEGFQTTKVVDPKMVLKKKGGKDEEVQDGWVGRIIPFSLVQKTLQTDELEAISKLEEELSSISSKYSELIEELDEDEKDNNQDNALLDESKESFNFANVSSRLKDLKKDTSEEGRCLLSTLKKVEGLQKQEKEIKKNIKSQSAALETASKELIENLDDEEVKTLLRIKWIDRITEGLAALPSEVVNTLITSVDALSKKYASTFSDIESQIQETEKELSSMLDDLTGNEYDMIGINELKKLLGGV